jgi:hypothetical protein
VDHVVVPVFGDLLAIVDQMELFVVVVSVGQLQDQRGVAGVAGEKFQVELVESGFAGFAADERHSGDGGFAAHRQRDRRDDRNLVPASGGEEGRAEIPSRARTAGVL